MEIETIKELTKLQEQMKEQKRLIGGLKKDIQELKMCFPSKESFNNLEIRVVKIEANLSKVIWLVLSAVISAILLLVLK